MTILNVSQALEKTGQNGSHPAELAVDCNNTLTEVITAGFLTPGNIQPYSLGTKDLVRCSYSGGVTLFNVSIASDSTITLSVNSHIDITTIDGNFANFSNTTGAITDDGFSPTDPAKTKVVMANGPVIVGDLAIFTDTAGTLDDTPNLLTDNQQFIGINQILIASVGTWTRTRIAQGNYVLRHTAADDTSVISIDITEAIRTTASKGFRLASIDVIYSIGTLALDTHSMVLDQIIYANNAAVTVTSVPLTGSLSIATQVNPYITNLAITTPAFSITADSKYVAELTVNAAATSAYDFYGLNLRFSKTVA